MDCNVLFREHPIKDLWAGWPEYHRRCRAARFLTGGLSPLWPTIHTVIADAGYESKGLSLDLKDQNGWKLTIVKRKEQAFQIAGLNWIVGRSFAWLGRQRRMSKDYEYRVQTSATLITIAACALVVRRIAP